MASTRNKNTRSDYCLEQNINNNLNTYLLYQNASYGQAYNSAFPGDYVNMGKMPNTVLSKNSTDIENEKDFPTISDLMLEQQISSNEANTVHHRRDLDSLG